MNERIARIQVYGSNGLLLDLGRRDRGLLKRTLQSSHPIRTKR
jgi:hypothetical protein